MPLPNIAQVVRGQDCWTDLVAFLRPPKGSSQIMTIADVLAWVVGSKNCGTKFQHEISRDSTVRVPVLIAPSTANACDTSGVIRWPSSCSALPAGNQRNPEMATIMKFKPGDVVSITSPSMLMTVEWVNDEPGWSGAPGSTQAAFGTPRFTRTNS